MSLMPGRLDVRMLLTPGVKIAGCHSEERIARLTRMAVSVTTPHHGTPLANRQARTRRHSRRGEGNGPPALN